jgi:LysM repeat protein
MAKKSAQSVISSYRKKQKSGPVLGIILAVILILAGIVIVIVWAVGNGSGGGLHLFATKTPTPTETPTPTPVTPTATATNTPTVTNTPTITPTPTASAPFEYVVQEDDNCTTIAEQYDVDIEVLLALNNLGSDCFIRVGDIIMIPAPGQQLPTVTPLPTDILPGTKIEYRVRSGDTLSEIATRLNSTVERIIIETNKYRTANKLDLITDDNDILVGDILIVPVNIVTPVPSATATRTSTP